MLVDTFISYSSNSEWELKLLPQLSYGEEASDNSLIWGIVAACALYHLRPAANLQLKALHDTTMYCKLLYQGVTESPIPLLNTLSSPGCSSPDPINCILELTGIHQVLIQLQRSIASNAKMK